MTDKYFCPRRAESPASFKFPDHDVLSGTCSYCGSLNPNEFMRLAEAGAELGPTDKNYKVYVDKQEHKFYFQHLSDEQKHKFIELLNGKKLNIGYPAYFYVLPFFIQREPSKST